METQAIAHDNFETIVRQFDALAQRLAQELGVKAPELPVRVNITGGNKLMAAAGLQWAILNKKEAFYLDRENHLIVLRPTANGLKTESTKLDPSIADGLDAVSLLKCSTRWLCG